MADKTGYTRTISTAELTETPRLELEQATGDVHVEGWDRQEIEVSISDQQAMFDVQQVGSHITVRSTPGSYKLVNFLGPALEELPDFGIDPERVTARVERKVERSMRHLRRQMGINIDLGRWAGGRDYRIRVPHNCDLTLRTSTGDMFIGRVSGTLFVQSTSGDIRMEEVGGNVLVTSASGDVSIQGLEGILGVRTASGGLKVLDARLTEVSASTSSADIELDLRSVPERDFNIKTVSGDVDINLPSDIQLTAQITTVSGEISCGFRREQVDYKVGRGRDTSLIINGGGPVAHLQSVSGDVTVRPGKGESFGFGASIPAPTVNLSRASRQEGGEGEPSQAARVSGDITQPEGYAARREAELEILQAVERGEISSQEALRRLTELAG